MVERLLTFQQELGAAFGQCLLFHILDQRHPGNAFQTASKNHEKRSSRKSPLWFVKVSQTHYMQRNDGILYIIY